MTKLPPGFDIPPGSEFPDLRKAKLNLKLEDIVKGLLDDDQEVFQLAQDKKVQLNKQRSISNPSGSVKQGRSSAATKTLVIRRIY